MRQFAWLNTAPQIEHKGTGPRPKPITRLKAADQRGDGVMWPPNPAPYLTDWLIEIGPSLQGGMAEAPIGWVDMAAWQSLTGIDLDPWEAKTLRHLSQAFVAQRYAAEKPDCTAPYNGELSEAEAKRVDVARRAEAAFRYLAGLRPDGGGDD